MRTDTGGKFLKRENCGMRKYDVALVFNMNNQNWLEGRKWGKFSWLNLAVWNWFLYIHTEILFHKLELAKTCRFWNSFVVRGEINQTNDIFLIKWQIYLLKYLISSIFCWYRRLPTRIYSPGLEYLRLISIVSWGLKE